MAEIQTSRGDELRQNYSGSYYDIPIFPGCDIGTVGLRHAVALPDGYQYADTIVPEDGARLLREHYPGLPRFVTQSWISGDAVESHESIDILYVGVEHLPGKQLVGIGRLAYREYVGILSSFVVDIDHRCQGVGRAIVDARIDLADRLGIVLLQMPRLATTNTLRSYYLEKGFQQIRDGRYVRTSKAVLESLTRG